MDEEEKLKLIGAEVYEVLKNVSKEKYDKLPSGMTKLFKKFENEKLVKKIDPNKSFKEQEISQEAKDIIFFITLDYWLDEEQKERILKNMKMNEQKFNEKYSYENLFKPKQYADETEKKNNDAKDEERQTLVIQRKEKFLNKIINKLKEIFFKKKDR